MLLPISRCAAVLQGDHDHVATRSACGVVRDLGTGNRVTGPGSVVTAAAPVGACGGAASAAAERTGAARMLQQRFGTHGVLMGREAAREAAPR